jgi:hypothetical protein
MNLVQGGISQAANRWKRILKSVEPNSMPQLVDLMMPSPLGGAHWGAGCVDRVRMAAMQIKRAFA